MNTPLLLYQIAFWVNVAALMTFFSMEIFWFIKGKGPGNIPTLLLGFFIQNVPFLILAVSMYFQAVPEGWIGVLRLMFLLICVPINLWLHYHGDKGGNSVGMLMVFFLLASIPLIVIMEVIVALY